MDPVPLSAHERRVLYDIERALDDDRRLYRAMHFAHQRRRRAMIEAVVRLRLALLGTLAAVSLILLTVGIALARTGLIWAAAGCWTLTVILGCRLLCRWSEPAP
ncbi:DUF3040 domain-containing protein [Streptomyces sp. NPDC047123]|uniref:DUF3040 domain-containing protein n=1 Tax=Streptomyces sp. NPDC047123 TaxID=3155622 RepID=UPI0033E66CFA